MKKDEVFFNAFFNAFFIQNWLRENKLGIAETITKLKQITGRRISVLMLVRRGFVIIDRLSVADAIGHSDRQFTAGISNAIDNFCQRLATHCTGLPGFNNSSTIINNPGLSYWSAIDQDNNYRRSCCMNRLHQLQLPTDKIDR